MGLTWLSRLPALSSRGALGLLLLLYLGLAFTLSVVQPMGTFPDEAAHMWYVKFLAREHRLPLFNPQTGGEAGYETQHPPLYYTLAALVYGATAPLPEPWRWHAVRWLSLVVGAALLYAAWRFFRAVAPHGRLALLALCGLALTPNFLAYSASINPDLLGVLWVTIGLGLALLAYRRPGDLRLAAALGLVSGLAWLCKLSATPILAVALLAQWAGERRSRPALGPPAGSALAVTLLIFLLTCGWYFGRNMWLYGTPFVHMQTGGLGTGLGALAHLPVPVLLRFLWVPTFTSTWGPTSWVPVGASRWVFYLWLLALCLLAAAGLWWARRRTGPAAPAPAARDGLNLAGLLLGLVVLAHQAVFWFSDVELHMGGRYLFVALPALCLLLAQGLTRWGPRAGRGLSLAWILLLLVADFVAVWYIVSALNPAWTPGWRLFELPAGLVL